MHQHFTQRLTAACLFLAAFMLVSGISRAQDPQSSILGIYAGQTRGVAESDTMIADLRSHIRVVNGQSKLEWAKIIFRDKDGGNPRERILPTGISARYDGLFARGEDFFFQGNGNFYYVNKDPSKPIRSGGYVHEFCDATDKHFIIRNEHAQQDDGIWFRARSSDVPGGRVPTNLRVQRLISRGKDIVFTSRMKDGRFRIHQMNYPDFSRGPVTKMKIRPILGVFTGIPYFGRDFAVTHDSKGQFSVVRFNDPAKKGKPGLYPLDADSLGDGWFECGGELLLWQRAPKAILKKAVFASNRMTMRPLGMPEGFLGSTLVAAGPDSFYLSGPKLTYGSIQKTEWYYRLKIPQDPSLRLDSPVASERDGFLRFTARLDQAATHAVSFDYATRGASAVAGDDFTPTSGTAVIPAGSTKVEIDVPLLEDFTIEPPESLELLVSNVKGASCASLKVVGRIRGSGARMVESVVHDHAGQVTAKLNGTTTWEGSVSSFEIAGRTVEARPLGLEAFWPAPDSGDGFRYARAVPLGSLTMKLCQFSGTSGELLEVFDHAPFFASGGELWLGKELGYERYTFFDGWPVVSLDRISPTEGLGEQSFIVHSERSRRSFEFAADWQDPTMAAGDISFQSLESGDVSFRIDLMDVSRTRWHLPHVIRLRASEEGKAGESVTFTNLWIREQRELPMRFFPINNTMITGFAGSGNRVWLSNRVSKEVEAFDLVGGQLVRGPRVALPQGSSYYSLDSYEFGPGHSLAYDGSHLVALGMKPTGAGLITLTGADGPKPRASFIETNLPGTSVVTAAGYVVSSKSTPSTSSIPTNFLPKVQLRDTKSLLWEMTPSNFQGNSFGYSMAATESMLWIASPVMNGGRVDGYRMGTFQPAISIISPQGIPGGVFGHSIAAHGPYLVIGEPSNSAPGAAWVFSADGNTLLKRLESGEAGRDRFGCRVAVRNGRILVGSGRINGGFGSDAPAPPDHRPVFLWRDLDSRPFRLVPSTLGKTGFASGYRIALLNDGVVITAGTEDEGGLEFLAFPASTFATSAAPAHLAQAGAGPLWPEDGATNPEVIVLISPDGGVEVSAALGGIPTHPEWYLLEGSKDLKSWKPLADFAGSDFAPASGMSISLAPGRLKVVLKPGGERLSFFRIRRP